MYFRVLRFMTRPMIIAAHRERRETGIPLRHAHPPFRKLAKRHRYIIVMAYPFLHGAGEGIPHMNCVIMWPEGGLRWQMDITLDRWAMLPRMTVENPHAYRL